MMQGLAGWMALTGEPDGPPTKSGLSLVDLSGGYVAAIARAGRALARAPRRRRLRLRRLAASRRRSHELVYVGTWAAIARLRRRRGGRTRPTRRSCRSRTSRPPTAGSSSRRRRRSSGSASARRSAGRSSPRDPRFADFGARDRNRDELRRRSSRRRSARGRRRSGSSVLARGRRPVLAGERRRCGARGPQTSARSVVEYEHPTLGTVRQVASPLRLSDARAAGRPRAVPRASTTGK